MLRFRTRPHRLYDLHFCWRVYEGALEFALLDETGMVDETTWHIASERTHSPAVLADYRARFGLDRRRCVLRDWLFGTTNW